MYLMIAIGINVSFAMILRNVCFIVFFDVLIPKTQTFYFVYIQQPKRAQVSSNYYFYLFFY